MQATSTPLGAVFLLGGIAFKPSSFRISNHEVNQAPSVMGVLSFCLGGLLVWSVQRHALLAEVFAFIDGIKLSA